MEDMLRILHTGDIHLDSPFSKLDPRLAEQRRQELRRTFVSAMQYAKDKQVDLVLIAGDLFDHGFVTRETMALLFCALLFSREKPQRPTRLSLSRLAREKERNRRVRK